MTAQDQAIGCASRRPSDRGRHADRTDGEATTIRIDRGEVWITEEGSFIDHILAPVSGTPSIARAWRIVAAQGDVRVTLFAPRIGPRPARIPCGASTLYFRPAWWDVIASIWPAFMRRASRRSFA